MDERGAERPRRPAIPTALYALATTLVVERFVLARELAEVGAFLWPLLALMAILCGTLLFVHRTEFVSPVAVICLSAAVALLVSATYVVNGEQAVQALSSESVEAWDFVLTSDPRERRGSYRCRASVRGERGHVTDVWLTLPERLPQGSVVRCAGTYTPPGESEWDVSSRMQGVWGDVRGLRIVEVRAPGGFRGALMDLRQQVCASFGPTSTPSRALLAGVVCAQREGLDAFGLSDTFSRCGISHLVAVSGGHLAVLTMMLAALLEALQVRKSVRTVATSCVSGAFVAFCGMPVSAVRAFLMTEAALVGGIVGRRSHALSSVSVMALAMALARPELAGQLGFVLSVVSVSALSLFSPYVSYAARVLVGTPRLPTSIPWRVRGPLLRLWYATRSSVATSLVVLVVTLPLTVEAFGEFSVVGPVANALLSAPFSLLVGMGVAAAALWRLPLLQAPVLACCDLVGSLVVCVARLLAARPGSSVVFVGDVKTLTMVVTAGAIVLLVWWPQVSRKHVGAALSGLAMLAAVLLVRWGLFAPARICVLDIGQGDAILVQQGSHALLVDAGPDEAIAAALVRNHVLRLDGVLLTHLHDDHYGGLESLVGRIGCEQVLVARGVADGMPPALGQAARDLTGCAPVEVGYGDVLQVGGFRLRVVSPTEVVDGTENAHSVELLVRYGDAGGRQLTALLTGDAERDEMAGLIERQDVGDIDLLKVGHHGSEVSLTAEQARVLDAEVAVASAGENNSYGHPKAECVEVLEGSGSVFLCTKDVGDVEVRPGSDGPVVRCQRPSGKR